MFSFLGMFGGVSFREDSKFWQVLKPWRRFFSPRGRGLAAGLFGLGENAELVGNFWRPHEPQGD